MKKEITTNSLMVSGNVDLAVKWKMGFSSGYDFAKKELHLLNCVLKEI